MKHCSRTYDEQYQRLNEEERLIHHTVVKVMVYSRKAGLSYVLFAPGKHPEPGVGLPKNAARAFNWMYDRLAEDEESRAFFARTPLPDGEIRPLAYCIAHDLMEYALQLPDMVQSKGGANASERIEALLLDLTGGLIPKTDAATRSP